MRARFMREVVAAKLPPGPGPDTPVTEEDLAPLPATARRYLRYMGVVGRPRDWSFRARFAARFRLKPTGAWLPAEMWQYNTRLGIARLFHMTVRFGGLVPVLARDTYLRGRGRMQARLFDLFTVADAAGVELDTGELVTYLNDGILLAPSLLLGPETRWSPVDDASFDIALTDAGRTVTARVFVNEEGAAMNFSTTDRFVQDPANPKGPMVRARWTTPLEGWQLLEGRRLPTRGQAVWHLAAGPFAYAELVIGPGALAYNVRPGE